MINKAKIKIIYLKYISVLTQMNVCWQIVTDICTENIFYFYVLNTLIFNKSVLVINVDLHKTEFLPQL